MATTTGGTTYVTSTDLVANYPTASLALANRVDVVASGGPNSIKTAGYTITLADILGGNKFLYNSASPGTFTLPTSGLVDGMVVNVAQIGAGALTDSGGTIVGSTVTTAQYQGLQFVYASTGTTWYSVAPNATAPGLAIVTPTSIANSGGSASASGGAITFSAVTSLSLNGIFSSLYDVYDLIMPTFSTSAAGIVDVRMRLAGTDNTAASYSRRQVNYYGTTVVGEALSGGTALDAWQGGTSPASAKCQIFSPATATPTMFIYNGGTRTDGTISTLYGAGAHNVSTAYDGITLFMTSGTMTGTVRVYGYKNS